MNSCRCRCDRGCHPDALSSSLRSPTGNYHVRGDCKGDDVIEVELSPGTQACVLWFKDPAANTRPCPAPRPCKNAGTISRTSSTVQRWHIERRPRATLGRGSLGGWLGQRGHTRESSKASWRVGSQKRERPTRFAAGCNSSWPNGGHREAISIRNHWSRRRPTSSGVCAPARATLHKLRGRGLETLLPDR